MKTSVKLLIGLFLVLIVAMFGAAVSLRHQYDSFDKGDPYARWKKQPLAPFRVVQISGPNLSNVVQIEPGTTPRLLADTLTGWKATGYTVRVERDTLFVQLNPYNGTYYESQYDDFEWKSPVLVVQAPRLPGIQTNGVTCQLRGFSSDSLQLQQSGQAGRIIIDKVRLSHLTATVAQKSQLVFNKATNDIDWATITLRDSARLAQYGSFGRGLTLTTDPGTNVRLMGKDLQRIRQAGR